MTSGISQADSLTVGSVTRDTLLNWQVAANGDIVQVDVQPFLGIVDGNFTAGAGGSVSYDFDSSHDATNNGAGVYGIGANGTDGDGVGATLTDATFIGSDPGGSGSAIGGAAFDDSSGNQPHDAGGSTYFMDVHGLVVTGGDSHELSLNLGSVTESQGYFVSLGLKVYESDGGTSLSLVTSIISDLTGGSEVVNLVLGAGNYFIEIFGEKSGIFNSENAKYTTGIVATPIPPAFLLFLSGLVGLVAVGRRRRAQAAA